jgi:uncharacterized repeat protein (TIGR02543 family)
VTLYAHWSDDTSVDTVWRRVTFNTNGFTVSTSATPADLYTNGTRFSGTTDWPAPPTRGGYTFKGWFEETTPGVAGSTEYVPGLSTALDLTGVTGAPATGIHKAPGAGDSETRLIAKWKADFDEDGDSIADGPQPEQWATVTFDARGGTPTPEPVHVNLLEDRLAQLEDGVYETWPTSGEEPLRDGYVFKEWNSEAAGNGMTYTAATIVTIVGDTTAYAQYTATYEDPSGGEIPRTEPGWNNWIRISFDADGGTPVPGNLHINLFPGEEEFRDGETWPDVNPEKPGYTFGGWFDGADEYTSADALTKALAAGDDITLKAKWTANPPPPQPPVGPVYPPSEPSPSPSPSEEPSEEPEEEEPSEEPEEEEPSEEPEEEPTPTPATSPTPADAPSPPPPPEPAPRPEPVIEAAPLVVVEEPEEPLPEPVPVVMTEPPLLDPEPSVPEPSPEAASAPAPRASDPNVTIELEDVPREGMDFGELVLDILKQIRDGEVPTGAWTARGVWSLLNLTLAIIGLISIIIVVILRLLRRKYSVTYHDNGATGGAAPEDHSGDADTDSNKYLSGTSVTVLGKSDLTKEGYTFTGWASSEEKANAAIPVIVHSADEAASGTKHFEISSDTDFYAVWTPEGKDADTIRELMEDAVASDGEYEYSRRRTRLLTFAAIICGLALTALFIFLEDIKLPMALIDIWSALFLLVFLGHFAILIIRRLLKTKKIDEAAKIEKRYAV